MKKLDNKQLQARRDSIVEKLSTETLPIQEFETLCRERNEIAIEQRMRNPQHFTKQERQIGYSYSLPSGANPQR